MAIHVEMAVGASPGEITAAVEGLVAQNVELMAQAELAGAPYPPLYASGVRYRREPKGRERWDAVDVVYKNRSGDCEDLCGIRAAELQRAGEAARAIVVPTRRNTFHVLVQRASGEIEDPSRILLEMEGHMKKNKPKICVKPLGDHYIGAIELPLNGRDTVQALEIGFDPWTALQKVVHTISAIVQNPAVASVLPPQAVLAVAIADKIASMSPEGLRALMKHPSATPAQKKLAGAVVASKEQADREIGFGLTDALTLAVSPALYAAGQAAKAVNAQLHQKSGSTAPSGGGNVRVINRTINPAARARREAAMQQQQQPVPVDPYGNPMVDPYGTPIYPQQPAPYPYPYPYPPQAPYPYPPQAPGYPMYPPGWEGAYQQAQPLSLDEAAAIALWGAQTFAEGSFPGYTPGFSQDYPGQPGYYQPPYW